MANCDRLRDLIDEAEGAAQTAYAAESDMAIRSVIGHPSDASSGYLRAKNKKLVNLAVQAHHRMWNTLSDYLWELGEKTKFIGVKPLNKAAQWTDWLEQYYKISFGIAQITMNNPRRVIAADNFFKRMIEQSKKLRLTDENVLPQFQKYSTRLERGLLPPTISSWSKDMTGLLHNFITASTELTESSRTFGYKATMEIAKTNASFRRKIKDIISDKPVTADYVMDGFIVKTRISEDSDFREVKFLGSYLDDNNILKHRAVSASGIEVEIEGEDILRKEIESGLIAKYMNELVNQLSSGDARYIEWTNNQEATKQEISDLRDVLSRAEAKSKMKESSGEMFEISRRGFSYTYAMIKETVGKEKEGHGLRERYKAYILNHTDERTGEVVLYLDEKDKSKLHNGAELFADENGYHKARMWVSHGHQIGKYKNKFSHIPFSVDKQPYGFMKMPNQPHPLLVGDESVPSLAIGDAERLSMWQVIGNTRNTLKAFGQDDVIPTAKENSKRIEAGIKKMPEVARKLGWSDDLVPEGETAELYYASKILKLWGGLQSMHVSDATGDIHTRNSFFNMKKENYYPWSWWQDITADMAGEAIQEINMRASQVLNPTKKQQEEWADAKESLWSIIKGIDPHSKNDDAQRSKINIGGRAAMLKHRKLWTDPTRRRVDGGVLKEYISGISFSLQQEALAAQLLETIGQLADMSDEGHHLLQTEVDYLINRFKVAIGDPTAAGSFPLPFGGTINYDNTVVAGMLNGVSKQFGWGVEFDEASAQKYITMVRGLISANLLKGPSALVNRTQSTNSFVITGIDYFTRANDIMKNDFIDDQGTDWRAIIELYGTDQLVTALADITAPAEEVDMRDMGFYPIPAPVLGWIPTAAVKSLYRMKVWGKDGFITRGIPEIDKWLQQIEENRLYKYREKKNFLKNKGLPAPQAKRMAKILQSIEYEWHAEKTYDKRRNITELRKALIEYIKLDEGKTPEEQLNEEVIKARLNNLFGHVSENRLRKTVAWTLSWLPIGPASWFTFTGGEKRMRRHALLSHMLMVGDSGWLGEWAKESIDVTYINDKGEEKTATINKMWASPKAMQIGRRALRDEFFGMTKAHMAEAMAGGGDLILQFKGYQIQQQHNDYRLTRAFMDGSIGFGEAVPRIINEYQLMIHEARTGRKYSPFDPNIDHEARAMARMIMSRLATTAFLMVMEFIPISQRFILGTGTGQVIRNVMRGAEDPLFRIAVRVLLRGLIYSALDDEDAMIAGGREIVFDIARLFLPLLITLPMFEIFYGARDAKRIWERYK